MDPQIDWGSPEFSGVAAVEAATLHTSAGDIVLRLFAGYTPKTVANFAGLAAGLKRYTRPNARGGYTGPFYDGSVFHRVIAGAWIQGGDPTGTGHGHPGYHFGDEFQPRLIFDRAYLLAMANAGPGTNGSQFFITLAPQPQLNFRNTIFGMVDDHRSIGVVDAISNAATGRGDRPLEDVVLRAVRLHTSAERAPVPLRAHRTVRLPIPERWKSARHAPGEPDG